MKSDDVVWFMVFKFISKMYAKISFNIKFKAPVTFRHYNKFLCYSYTLLVFKIFNSQPLRNQPLQHTLHFRNENGFQRICRNMLTVWLLVSIYKRIPTVLSKVSVRCR